MFDFTHIVDFIFKNQSDYKKLSNEDKEKFFFIINRKLARKYPKHAQFFNNKNIDKSNALDLWYYFFLKKGAKGIPSWYWGNKKKTKKEKPLISKEECVTVCNLFDVTEKEIDFLIQNYPEYILELSKKIRIFNK